MLRLYSIARKMHLMPRKHLSTTAVANKRHCCKLLVVGGGTGGCSMAAKFAKIFGKYGVIIIEPEDIHYYQPYFTFVGGGVKKIRDCVRTTIEVLPEDAVWLHDAVKEFSPQSNCVVTKKGHTVEYDFMIIAVGVSSNFDEVKGLTEALDNYRNVCSIFPVKYVEKTFKCLREFVSGNALFTAPKTPTKCLAAGFKICFIAQDYFKREDKLSETEITYTTAQRLLFPVKEYDKTLWDIMKRKRVDVQLRTNLIEVIPDRKKAVFVCMDNPQKKISMEYSMLHVTPPMSPPEELKNCRELVNDNKYVDVDKNTLQHKKYKNIFAIGDCTPGTSNKTASAITRQSNVVFKNLLNAACGQPLQAFYNGYTACPIIAGYETCLLAEFDYDLKPHETFLFQNAESKLMYYFMKDIMPYIYWNYLLKGKWSGTERLRKILHLGFVERNKK